MTIIPSKVPEKKVGYIIIILLHSPEKEICTANAGRQAKNMTTLCLIKDSCKEMMAGKALLYVSLFLLF